MDILKYNSSIYNGMYTAKVITLTYLAPHTLPILS